MDIGLGAAHLKTVRMDALLESARAKVDDVIARQARADIFEPRSIREESSVVEFLEKHRDCKDLGELESPVKLRMAGR